MSAEAWDIRIMWGDKPEWEMQFFSKARIKHVWATFVMDAHTAHARKLVLSGAASLHRQTSEGRVFRATLGYAQQSSDDIEPGDYHFIGLEGQTANRTRYEFEDTVGQMIIRVDPEPQEDQPRLMENEFRIV